MSKNYFGGATINSGPTLPLASEVPDGSLFYKTSAPSGLYFFGFNPDANSGLLGDQATQGWALVADTSGAAPYVLKSGDVMTGRLWGTAFRAAQGAPNSADLSTNGFAFSTDGDTGLFSIGSGNIGSSLSLYLNNVERLRANDGGSVTIDGGLVWTANTDGAGSGLDADLLDGQHGAYYLNPANFTGGAMPVSAGGTGQNAGLTQGGVIYAASTSMMAASSAGSSGFLLSANGASAPGWVNPATITVGTATTATSATTATTAGSAGAVPFTGITGLGAFATASITLPSLPNATTTATARPSYFFDMGNNPGTLSMRPTQFPQNSISGWNAYGSSDMGNYQTGLTVVGSSGAYGLQIAANWNFEEGAPTGLRYRVNDDTSDTAAWGAFQTLWDSGNFTPTNYVSKAGNAEGVMTGSLTTTALAVGAVSVPSTGSINMSGNLTLLSGFVSANGNLVSNGGNILANSLSNYVQAGTPASGGLIRLQASGSGNSGTLEFFGLNQVRSGYIGNTGTTGTTDGAVITYVAAAHAFTGNMTVSGNIVAQGNITAFSDRRLKSYIEPIANPIEKVLALNGVNFNRKGSEERHTGLIAQDVKAVMPEAVVEDTDGMMSVAYGNLVGLLVEAIKAQQKQIDDLKWEVMSLKGPQTIR